MLEPELRLEYKAKLNKIIQGKFIHVKSIAERYKL